MKIGLDLDQTVFGFPGFFREFVKAMIDQGHEIFCTTGHPIGNWPKLERKLRRLGFNPADFDRSLMKTRAEIRRLGGKQHKARMADQVDIVFDDHADHFQGLTKTPVLRTPGGKAGDT